LREDTTVPGRMPDLVKRFQDHVFAGVDRHGIDSVFVSQTEIRPSIANEVVFVQRFDSHPDKHEEWDAFILNPVWSAAGMESEKHQPMLTKAARRILNPPAFLLERL
jgi:NIPSNAP